MAEFFQDIWDGAAGFLRCGAEFLQESLLSAVRHGQSMSHRQLAVWLGLVVLCYVGWQAFSPGRRR